MKAIDASGMDAIRSGIAPTAICIAALLIAPPSLAEPIGDMSQLMQLNQSSQEALWWMQAPRRQVPGDQSLDQRHAHERLYRQQQMEQQLLQEGQRRELLLRNERARITGVPDSRQRLDAIHRQRQFQQQQWHQLNGFRGHPGRW